MGNKILRKKKDEPMGIDPVLYPSGTDMVVAINDKVRKSIDARKYEYNGIYVSLDKITQKMPFNYLRINQCL